MIPDQQAILARLIQERETLMARWQLTPAPEQPIILIGPGNPEDIHELTEACHPQHHNTRQATRNNQWAKGRQKVEAP